MNELYDPDVKFLLLDDVIPCGGDKVDLIERNDDDLDRINGGFISPRGRNHNRHRFNMPSSAMRNHNNTTCLSANKTRLSLGGLSITMDNNNASDGINSAAKVLVNNLVRDVGNSGGLRLLDGCDVNDEGVLLMPGSAIGTPKNIAQMHNGDENSNIDPNDEFDGAAAAAGEADDFAHDNAYDDDTNNEGVGFELNDTNNYDEVNNNMLLDEQETGGAAANAQKEQIYTMDEQSSKATKRAAIIRAVEHVDRWGMLDPHDASAVLTKSRPLKVGKTFKLPPGLDDAGSMVNGSRTRSRKRGANNSTANAFAVKVAHDIKRKYTNLNQSMVVSLKNHSDGGVSFISPVCADTKTIPLKGLVFGDEFAYIAKATAKRKSRERRLRQRQIAENPASAKVDDIDNLHEDQNHDFDYGGDDDYGGDYDMAGDEYAPNVPAAAFDDAFASNGIDRDVVSGNGKSFCCYDFINSLFVILYLTLNHSKSLFSSTASLDYNPDAKTFEELCRAHIRAFAQGAEKYAAETQLSKRVGEWQGRLAPILEEEGERPEFDIHKYGDEILFEVKDNIEHRRLSGKLELDGSKPKSPNVVDFSDVAQGCEPYQVGRLFLASLMLANSGNVELSHEEGAVTSSRGLRIELLEDEFKLPMEYYKAPSVTDVASTNSVTVA